MSKHPGGSLILEQTRGSDCTALFHSYHTFAKFDVSSHLARYYVRDSTADECSDSAMFEWARTPKFDAARKRIRAMFKDRTHKAPPFVQFYYFLWGLVFVSQGLRWFRDGNSVSAVLFGLSVYYFSGDMAHSGLHFALIDKNLCGSWSAMANLCLGYVD